MKTKGLLLAVSAMLVLALNVPFATAGVEPSPFISYINKLNSIELNVGAVQKRLENRVSEPVLPEGTRNYMDAIANQTGVLNLRLWDVLAELPVYEGLGDDREEIYLALDGIRTGSTGVIGLLEQIGRRMGVDPVPWKASLQAMILQINNYIGACPSGTACIPQ